MGIKVDKLEDEALVLNTIIYDELSIPPSEDLETVTRLHLREQCQDLILEGKSGTWVYGNLRGHSLLNQMHAWTRRIEILESKERQSTSERRAHERQTEEHKKEILALKRHNGLLMQNSDNYLDIRHRFLETYQRDIMNNPAFRGSAAIKAGNSKAYDGNALADAALYHRDRRSDTRLYRDLYGLDYREVLELNNSGTDDGGILLVLNAHATLLAQGKSPSKDVKEAFEAFLNEVERNWLKPANEEPTSPLGLAYYGFWKSYREQGA